jgi:hypothetical protein
MQELIGFCKYCHKPVYCLDGFFDGVILENREISCFQCDNKLNKDESSGNQ